LSAFWLKEANAPVGKEEEVQGRSKRSHGVRRGWSPSSLGSNWAQGLYKGETQAISWMIVTTESA